MDPVTDGARDPRLDDFCDGICANACSNRLDMPTAGLGGMEAPGVERALDRLRERCRLKLTDGGATAAAALPVDVWRE